jgi:hypothetical protein
LPALPKSEKLSPTILGKLQRLLLMLRHYLALVLMLATLPALAAEDPDIRELMTAEEFAASGLSSLPNEQIEAINRWLVRYTVEDSARMRRTSPAVTATVRTDVRSRIYGEFNGWDGYTRFRLKNGQVWETNTTRRYSYTALDPEVEITRNFLLIYRMRIVDTGKTISVRRIQ